MTLAGAAIGSLAGGPMADTIGRKWTILFADIVFTGGTVLMTFTPSIALLIVGRFIIGVGVGTAAMVVPVYLSEFCPARL